MRKTGLLYDERFMLHRTPPGYPEAPERLRAVLRGLKKAGFLPELIPIPATAAKLKWIETVHSPRYIHSFEEACALDLGEMGSADNPICPQTYEIALLAVGGILNAVDMLMEGKIDNAFCAVRPPGHHAKMREALGFCYFNNVAIAARYLQLQWNIARVGIVDFDVHHGNGTQHTFEDDPDVFYYSIHEHPSFSYPGTGSEFEKGSGRGTGTTLNSTILPGQGDEEYMRKIMRDLVPAFDEFRPEVILVSAGFDAHAADDISGVNLSTEGFSWIMEVILRLADRHAGGRLISVLEGGYSIELLPELIANHVRILLEL
ncbi:MAG TPA: histone deacetylase [Syntrophobacteraceae bacterium]|nr:histone deacetylase [Syntrophobacteraceae bacterium]